MIERIEINLLPAEYRVHKKKFHIPRETVYPVLILICVTFGLFVWSVVLQNNISIANNQLTALDQQINKNRPIHAEIKKLRDDKTMIEEKIRALQRINVNREKWVRLMEELSSRLPDYTWLISIKEENSVPPVLIIEGRTFSFQEVANYMSRLKESEYITAVDLSNIEQISPKERIYRFSISCTINPDAKLQKHSAADSSEKVN